MQSRSVNYTSTGDIELIELEVGAPGPGQIQLRGAVSGICSWDIATCKFGAEMSVPAPSGHEGIGYVTQIGLGVSGFTEGDRVAGGGFHTLKNHRIKDCTAFPNRHPWRMYTGSWSRSPAWQPVSTYAACAPETGLRSPGAGLWGR